MQSSQVDVFLKSEKLRAVPFFFSSKVEEHISLILSSNMTQFMVFKVDVANTK